MTTDFGREYIAGKLTSAKNLSDLAAVWASIAVAYQREPAIYQLKETLKKQMEAKKR
jgi:hypothetical protein